MKNVLPVGKHKNHTESQMKTQEGIYGMALSVRLSGNAIATTSDSPIDGLFVAAIQAEGLDILVVVIRVVCLHCDGLCEFVFGCRCGHVS